MAVSLSSLTSSFSSLSFSYQISSNPQTLSLPRIWSPPNTAPLRRNPPSAIVASSSSTAVAAVAGDVFAPTTADLEGMSLEKYVKSRLPGGFAAQKIIGTGRRKCAIARVVLQEGTGKFVINYRDAKVWKPFSQHSQKLYIYRSFF